MARANIFFTLSNLALSLSLSLSLSLCLSLFLSRLYFRRIIKMKQQRKSGKREKRIASRRVRKKSNFRRCDSWREKKKIDADVLQLSRDRIRMCAWSGWRGRDPRGGKRPTKSQAMFRAAQIKELRRLEAVDRDRRRESWATDRLAAHTATRRYVDQIFIGITRCIADNATTSGPVFLGIYKRWQHVAFLEQDTRLR